GRQVRPADRRAPRGRGRPAPERGGHHRRRTRGARRVVTADAVLTTGANSGIGLATVVELAKRGYRSIGSVRSEAKADVVHKAAADAGVTVETVILDVTDAGACAAVIEDLDVDLFGLVNNAGYGMTGAIED